MGCADVAVDWRRARRLAYRIAAQVRASGLPRAVWTSSLSRCRRVGEVLVTLGFAHRVDDRLREMDFGHWDGRLWDDIPRQQIDEWIEDFAGHAPGCGEALADVIARAREFVHDTAEDRVIVGHAGWISALDFLDGPPPAAAQWPAAIPYGTLRRHQILET